MNSATTTQVTTRAKLERAAAAASALAELSTGQKNVILRAMAAALEANQGKILAANAADLSASNLRASITDRLTLNPQRIAGIVESVRTIANLPDPVGEILSETVRPNGLRIRKLRVPLGVVGIVYESRPNVTVDAAVLALKAGNAVVLRGGREAARTNETLVEVMSQTPGLPEGAIELLDSSSRESVNELITSRGFVDVVIPRGGLELISHVMNEATVPVIETGAGNCHVYVDETADFKLADQIIVNAKTDRPSVCNAAEKVLVHQGIAAEYVPRIVKALREAGVEVRGDEEVCRLARGQDVREANEEDWSTEYSDLKIAIAVVDGLDDAIAHINRYSTKHSEAILTENAEHAARFLQRIDSAAVYWNASTRFTDGGEFGYGAEMGISTQKLHCRGPFGLRELTTTKYQILGTGQIRAEIPAKDGRENLNEQRNPQLKPNQGSIGTMQSHLNLPHGGELINLIAGQERSTELQSLSKDWPSWDLTARQLCDVELLLNGGFSPLRSFLSRADYESVCLKMRLVNGTIWPIPVVLDLPEAFAKTIAPGKTIALRDPEGVMLAALHVEEIWQPDRTAEAVAVYGTADTSHPGSDYLLNRTNPFYVSGKLEGLQLPSHYDFNALRQTPAELRAEFARMGWQRVVAFQTRNPMHRAHQELTFRAAKQVEANLLIQPSVGMTKPGDVEYYVRVRCYQAFLDRYPKGTVKLSLLPLAMRMGGPREAVWHAIIRKNYGCSHFIVGRDHAGPGSDKSGKPFYGSYDAQKMVMEHQKELGITAVPFNNMVYLQDQDTYVEDNQAPAGAKTLSVSGTELRNRLSEGRELPGWFTYPEVAKELQRSYPARANQGFTIFFTGLSGSGKSTIANILNVKFLERGGRPVTLLDGDLVRKNLSSELGFSKEHRDLNIKRIGYVASEITKNGGIAICAPIAPYDSVRKDVRGMIQPHGGFILVHLATSLETCESRDRKGLYAKARAGIVKQFTGISDPYEAPEDAEMVIDTAGLSPEEAAQQIILHLQREGFIGAAGRNGTH
jgi:sulfate adenylyltransferase